MTTASLQMSARLDPRAVLDNGVMPAVAGLAGIFLLANLLLPRVLAGGWSLYLAQPLLWCALGLFCLSRPGFETSRPGYALASMALLCGGFQVAALLLGGMLYGFGYSGYSHRVDGIAANLWFLTAMLFGTEMARSLLLQRLRLFPIASFFAVAGLFAVINLSLGQLQALSQGGQASLMLGGERLLPSVAGSLLATLLSALGGPYLAMAYRAVPLLFEWLSPVLPALPWLPAAIIGTLAPALAFMYVQSITAEPDAEPAVRSSSMRFGWVAPFTLAVAVAIGFNAGLFGVQPAVVSGISMEPNLRLGDIVITRPVSPAEVRTGDVIKFRLGEVAVLHRVVEVRQAGGEYTFITQGDNNNYFDGPVPQSAVEGRVVLVVPKLGLLPVTVKNWLAR